MWRSNLLRKFSPAWLFALGMSTGIEHRIHYIFSEIYQPRSQYHCSWISKENESNCASFNGAPWRIWVLYKERSKHRLEGSNINHKYLWNICHETCKWLVSLVWRNKSISDRWLSTLPHRYYRPLRRILETKMLVLENISNNYYEQVFVKHVFSIQDWLILRTIMNQHDTKGNQTY